MNRIAVPWGMSIVYCKKNNSSIYLTSNAFNRWGKGGENSLQIFLCQMNPLTFLVSAFPNQAVHAEPLLFEWTLNGRPLNPFCRNMHKWTIQFFTGPYQIRYANSFPVNHRNRSLICVSGHRAAQRQKPVSGVYRLLKNFTSTRYCIHFAPIFSVQKNSRNSHSLQSLRQMRLSIIARSQLVHDSVLVEDQFR